MNIILFDKTEIEKPFSANDPRIRHLLNVIHCQPGDSFDAGLIDGPRGKGTITAVSGTRVVLNFQWEDTVPQLYPVTLLIGHPRPQSVRRILKDATTLGAGAIHFVLTDKGEKSYLDSKLWQKSNYSQYLLEGAQQAFCTRIPHVENYLSLQQYLSDLNTAANLIALDNYESVIDLKDCPLPQKHTVLAIGSERGWSAAERDLLRQAGFTLAGLGKRVLTTDTAVIVGLGLLISKIS